MIGDGDLVWNMIREDWMGLERSSTVQYLLAKGKAEGLQEGIAKGLEQGIEQGIEKGIEQGIEQGIAKSIVAVLESRFGPVDPKIQERISGIEDRKVLERLLPLAATSPGIEAITRELGLGG